MADGTTRPLEMHVFPRSTGRVLRVLGAMIEKQCEDVTFGAVEEVRAIKLAQSGRHPTQFPPVTAPEGPPQDIPVYGEPEYLRECGE
jgi:hypothetical protein